MESLPPQRSDPVEQIVEATVKAIRIILQGRSWMNAFARNWFGTSKFCVRKSLMKKLGLENTPIIDNEWPTYSEFASIFPGRTELDFDVCWARGKKQAMEERLLKVT